MAPEVMFPELSRVTSRIRTEALAFKVARQALRFGQQRCSIKERLRCNLPRMAPAGLSLVDVDVIELWGGKKPTSAAIWSDVSRVTAGRAMPTPVASGVALSPEPHHWPAYAHRCRMDMEPYQRDGRRKLIRQLECRGAGGNASRQITIDRDLDACRAASVQVCNRRNLVVRT